MTEWASPRETAVLIGHEAAEQAFLDAYNGGRMAHAWLICGPKGVGKATLAFRMARFLLSQGEEVQGGGLFGEALPPMIPESLHMDPEDPLFHRVAAGAHGDLLVVEKEINQRSGKLRDEIVVDNVRGVGSFMSQTAREGGWRVVIVDAADEMNRNAANSLLKVLEEPPRRAILLLVAHFPGRLLPTIRSRCRKLTLQPLDDSIILDLLLKQMPDLSSEESRTLVALAEGSAARALTLAAEGGLELGQGLLAILDGLPDLDLPNLHKLADSLVKAGAGDRFGVACDMVRWWLSRRVRQAALSGKGGALDPWLQVWEKTDDLLARAAGLDLDRKQVFLTLLLTLQGAART
ncbi:DNA polymerase III subunit delta' [Magnetospira sp. QH-2]|uniref:DNA polymerase III subunit delta' n=1 Tax=Magnetospira sp. (strain QH-2) TaxID=1288970 RepID=UPI0003E817F3|nr:DNA polymerase III subunit delta' [Magnetospira sp. QH-2]CCQ73784.1 Putative DNA polymerase III, delta prime subunit [Magnetospira sp. QH-2]